MGNSKEEHSRYKKEVLEINKHDGNNEKFKRRTIGKWRNSPIKERKCRGKTEKNKDFRGPIQEFQYLISKSFRKREQRTERKSPTK